MKFNLALVAATMLAGVTTAQAVPVNLELALGVDRSGSVDAGEADLQRQGYINAFNDLALFGTFKPFAVTYYNWSSSVDQAVCVPWTLISNAADGAAFATAITSNCSLTTGGSTAVGNAIQFGAGLFDNNGFEGDRLVIDISGDGATNEGIDTATERDAAEAADITINALTIAGEPGLEAFYDNNVITSDGFRIGVNSFDDFEDAIFKKLQREIVPAPAALALFGLGVLALGVRRR